MKETCNTHCNSKLVWWSNAWVTGWSHAFHWQAFPPCSDWISLKFITSHFSKHQDGFYPSYSVHQIMWHLRHLVTYLAIFFFWSTTVLYILLSYLTFPAQAPELGLITLFYSRGGVQPPVLLLQHSVQVRQLCRHRSDPALGVHSLAGCLQLPRTNIPLSLDQIYVCPHRVHAYSLYKNSTFKGSNQMGYTKWLSWLLWVFGKRKRL